MKLSFYLLLKILILISLDSSLCMACEEKGVISLAELKLSDYVTIVVIVPESHADLIREIMKTIHQALELGYRHIDTADVYCNHQAIGLGITSFPRDQLFLTTKLSINDLTPSKIKRCSISF